MLRGKRILFKSFALLLLVKGIVLHISCDVVCFQTLIVLFGPITTIGSYGLRCMTIKDFVAFQVSRQGKCIGRIGVDIVIGNDLIVGADLYVVSRLKLTIVHMVFFHAHKSGIRVGFAIAVSAIQHFFFSLVFIELTGKVLLCILQLLLCFFSYLFTLNCRFYAFYRLFYLIGINGFKIKRCGISQFFTGYGLRILPQLIELSSHLFFIGLDSIAPY